MPVCVACRHFKGKPENGMGDKCSHTLNVFGLHPHALRNDPALCGDGVWFAEDASAAERAKQWFVVKEGDTKALAKP